MSVDPFDCDDTTTIITSETEKTFLSNVSNSKETNKIIVKKQYSDDFFKENTKTFTFIYIDGSHEPEQIVKDANNAIKVLEVGGVMWFDDYLGGPPNDRTIQRAIDSWVYSTGSSIQLIHKGYQLGCVKLN